MRIFGEITKLEPQDDGTIRVAGVASSGSVDDAEETVLPEAMKAALPAYMRFGALREMHGLSAAGATLSAQVDDQGLTRIEAHVVDPVAVKKVKLGVYKGFSIGGKVLERDPKDRKVITKLKLNEISLVDRPCNPDAVVEMWKADLSEVESPAGPSNAEVIAKARELAAAAGKPGRHTDFVVKAREALMVAQIAYDGCGVKDDPALVPILALEPTAKLGARNSRADLERIQAAHDHLVALGACCGGSRPQDMDDDDDTNMDGLGDPDLDPDGLDDADTPDANDIAADKALIGETLAKALADNAYLARRLEAAEPQIAVLRRSLGDLHKRVEQLAAQPLPPKAASGFARAISKAEDADPGAAGLAHLSAEEFTAYLQRLPEAERGQLQLRAALSRPIPIAAR